MTTPGGVPNLPTGALTIGTMATILQDTSHDAMKARAAERFSTIFDGSTGGSPAVDISPSGVITSLFAGFNEQVANADPADIDGPEDLPDLLLRFIEDIPVIGQFVELLEAINGTYVGDADILIAIQDIFAPIRALIGAVGDTLGGILPTVEQVIAGWTGQVDATTAAQNTADLALKLLFAKVGGGLGTSGSDPFDGAVLTTAPTNYTQTPWGSATNIYVRDGNGKLAFQTGGLTGNYSLLFRNDIFFVGDYQTTGVYLPSHIASGTQLILMNRFNHSTYEGYCAIVTDSTVQPAYMTNPSGTPVFHNLGTAQSYTQSDGEYWEFDVGDTDLSNDYMLRVRRNDDQVAIYDDTAHNVVADSAHRSIAVAGASTNVLFAVIPAPTIDTITYYERV